MKIIDCSRQAHGPAILAILNDAIVHSTAVYDYQPRPPESMAGWFRTKEEHHYPVLGAVADDGELLGFASYGAFRPWPAYKYSVEHSVYVHREHRRRGIGQSLVGQLAERARQRGYHQLVGGIDMENSGSIALHESLGFVHAGTIRQAAFKFGRWLDLGFWQLLLETPHAPHDG